MSSKKNFSLFIPPEVKARFKKKCSKKYEDMSSRIRFLINKDLEDEN